MIENNCKQGDRTWIISPEHDGRHANLTYMSCCNLPLLKVSEMWDSLAKRPPTQHSCQQNTQHLSSCASKYGYALVFTNLTSLCPDNTKHKETYHYMFHPPPYGNHTMFRVQSSKRKPLHHILP